MDSCVEPKSRDMEADVQALPFFTMLEYVARPSTRWGAARVSAAKDGSMAMQPQSMEALPTTKRPSLGQAMPLHSTEEAMVCLLSDRASSVRDNRALVGGKKGWTEVQVWLGCEDSRPVPARFLCTVSQAFQSGEG